MKVELCSFHGALVGLSFAGPLGKLPSWWMSIDCFVAIALSAFLVFVG
jgi:hypothetical protein